MEEQPQLPQNKSGPSLVLLKILCVFTFVGSGLGFFSFGIIALGHGYFLKNLALIPLEQNRDLIELLLSAGRIFFLLNAILYAVSFVGALLLWKMRKVGFHLYTISQILLLIIPLAYIQGFPMAAGTIFLTVLFIWGYSGFLKFMK
jgi:hypothetical protein